MGVAANSGLTGLPLALILTSWFFKYAYVLFDHTARGFDEPPTLDIDMVNPFNEQRPLAQVAILGLIYLAVKYAHDNLGSPIAGILTAAALFTLPASVAVLGLENNVLKAIYPVALYKIIVGLGPIYLLVLAIIAGYGFLMVLLAHWAPWLPLQVAADMFCVLSIFSVLGGAAYERRDELDLETWVSPERTEDLRLEDELRQSEKQVTEAYGLMRAGSHAKAWDQLQAWLATRSHAPDDYRWLCNRVVTWNDPRYITRLTQEHVERLMLAKRSGEALDVVTQRLIHDPNFRPKTAADTLAIAQLAAHGGGAHRVARTLLADFPSRFPGDPSTEPANALARHLGP
jgi:hypothetical protein